MEISILYILTLIKATVIYDFYYQTLFTIKITKCAMANTQERQFLKCLMLVKHCDTSSHVVKASEESMKPQVTEVTYISYRGPQNHV